MAPDAVDDFDTTVEQLYAGPSADFIARRDAAVKAARAAGDKDLADRLKQLRRPTAAAALINQLRRGPDRTGLEDLLELGGRLRDAQAALDVTAMKSLSTERNSMIASLLDRIGELSDDPLSGAVREQLSDTFTAAANDAEAGRAVGSGRLVSGLRYSGFGEVDLRDAVAAPIPASEGAVDARSAIPAATPADDDAAPADDTDAEADPVAEERAADVRRKAAEARLADARRSLETARAAEEAARQSAALADRALAAARKTAKATRARVTEAAAARAAAEAAVAEASDAAEAATTRP